MAGLGAGPRGVRHDPGTLTAPGGPVDDAVAIDLRSFRQDAGRRAVVSWIVSLGWQSASSDCCRSPGWCRPPCPWRSA